MAKTKEPSIQDALKSFKDVMMRAKLTNFLSVGNVLLSRDQGSSILVCPSQTLWEKILEDSALSSNIKELDISDKDQYNLQPYFSYIDNNQEDWIEIDPDNIGAGKIFKIHYKNFDYDIPINKDLLPLKLKKAEFNNISYRIYTTPNLTLSIRKYYPSKLDCDYSIATIFQIV